MRRLILGTDWWTDCDDAVAIRLLARAHRNREIQLSGIIINACMEDSVTSLEGFLNTEGVKNIPIGIDPAATDYGGEPPYQKRLTQYAGAFRGNADAEEAVRLYRKILSQSPEPVEIVEIGYLQAIAAFLQSSADEFSPLNGRELMLEKVSKIWVMAGRWDMDGGKENNFCRNQRSVTGGNVFCSLCPVPVTFLGWEIGASVITGGNLRSNDVLHRILCDFGSPEGRSSWDPMLALLAVIGNESDAGYDTVQGTASVDSKTGENHFLRSRSGMHCYVKMKMPPLYYEKMINDRICSV